MKVAVCISGQMRTYRQASESLMQNLVRPNQADVFVHTWNKAGNTNKLILFLPRGFHFDLPLQYWHDNPDLDAEAPCQFEKDLPNLYAELQTIATASDVVTTKTLLDIYSPLKCVVEEFDQKMFDDHLPLKYLRNKFEDATCLNAAPMFYKIYACDKLRQAHEWETSRAYDLVIRVRPDLHFNEVIDLSAYDPDVFRTLRNPFYEVLGISNTHSNDMMFMGNSSAMTFASSVWLQLPHYWDASNYPDWPLSARGPELILHRHLRSRDLHGDILSLDPLPHRVVMGINFPALIELLRRDLSTKRHLPAFVANCVAVCHGIHGVELFQSGAQEDAEAFLREPINIDGFLCQDPYEGRAKIANMKGDVDSFEKWIALAKQVNQTRSFPELFT